MIDPPFITREVWEKYAASAKLLLKPQPAEPAAATAAAPAAVPVPAVVAEAGEANFVQPPPPCGRVLCTTIVENR